MTSRDPARMLGQAIGFILALALAVVILMLVVWGIIWIGGALFG